MRRPLLWLLIFCCAGIIAGSAAAAPRPMTVRVCVIDDAREIPVILQGAYAIRESTTDKPVMEGRTLRSAFVAGKGGIGIGHKEFKVSGLTCEVGKNASIYLKGRRFRGEVDIILKDNGKLMAINVIEIEDYLYGVLYHEVSHRWPMGVLKAQAIAARTFAVYQRAQNKNQPYDLRNDIYSQVYGGRTSEKWATTQAVDRTRGEVLTYDGKIFPAYFHATCAGFTEDAANLWNIDLAPLKGVVCGFCGASPHYYWSKELPLWKLQNELKESGYTLGPVASISVVSRNRSGRVEKLEIKDEAGVALMMTAKDFRQMLGPNEIRSTRFDIEVKWNQVIIKGLGWGHGVGMCQWGAFGMAQKGKTAEGILGHYYPGSVIMNLDDLKTDS